MELNQGKVYGVYAAVKSLMEYDFEADLAWDLYSLEREMRPIYEFQEQQRRKVFMKYQPEYLKESNEFKFKTPEDCKAFSDQMEELDKMPAEIKNAPIRLPLSKAYKLKPNWISELEGIVEFFKWETVTEVPTDDVKIEPVVAEDVPAEVLEEAK